MAVQSRFGNREKVSTNRRALFRRRACATVIADIETIAAARDIPTVAGQSLEALSSLFATVPSSSCP